MDYAQVLPVYNSDQRSFTYPQDKLQYIKRKQINEQTISKFFKPDLTTYYKENPIHTSQSQIKDQEEKKEAFRPYEEKKTPHFQEKREEQEISGSPEIVHESIILPKFDPQKEVMMIDEETQHSC